jgi:hypothetical protein
MMEIVTVTRADIRRAVVEALLEVQESIGQPVPRLTDATRPIGDLPQFDSQLAEDTTATILAALGAPPDTKCPFTKKRDGQCLTLGQSVDFLCEALGVHAVRA